MKVGLEVLDFSLLKGKRVGLLTNPSAIDQNLKSAYQIFATSDEVNLTALFAPEHGFVGAAPDAAKIEDTKDPLSGAPVFSLYGKTLKPTPEMLENVDVIVCDIQDIGVRYYTFTWTVSYILEAGVEVIILDRPNPLGGLRVYGSPLDDHLRSFVGRFPIPPQHGMTLGELAKMINQTWNPNPCELTVIPCEGWERSMEFAETGLPWVPPSPNMPTLNTLLQYVGACLIEGTTLSEGRGTALPFEIVGAPWIDPLTLADTLNAKNWEGVRFRPHSFLPSSSKFKGEYCNGVQVYVTDKTVWQPLHVWLGIIQTIAQLYPDDFAWLPPYSPEVEPSIQHFDRLIGSEKVRQQIDDNQPIEAITADWEALCQDFMQKREQFLIY